MQGDLAGTYYPLTGMDEKVRQQLVDDHFLFVSGDKNLHVDIIHCLPNVVVFVAVVIFVVLVVVIFVVEVILLLLLLLLFSSS